MDLVDPLGQKPSVILDIIKVEERAEINIFILLEHYCFWVATGASTCQEDDQYPSQNEFTIDKV